MQTRTIQQTVQVTFRYPVAFTRDLFDPGNTTFRDALTTDSRRKLLVIVDDGVVHHHPHLCADVEAYATANADAFELVAPPLVLPGGERVKQNPAYVRAVRDAINTHGIDRHAFVAVIGGGAIIDMVGYAAATAHRGVRLVRVPTTVLSQNDSAVGVKNSVNAYGKKNWLGTFAPPYAVLCDLNVLRTLENRDWLGGLSEAVKVALLKDPAFFAYLEQHAEALRARDERAMQHAVVRCAELHLQHIATSGDAFELGSSRPLDFGHWAAHKLEALTQHELRHGEAVAVGIALDSTYAYHAGLLAETDWLRVISLFRRLGLSVYHDALTRHLDDAAHPDSILAGLNEFREHLGGRLTIMLLLGIGHGIEVHDMHHPTLKRAIRTLQSIHAENTEGDVCQHSPALAH